MNNAQLGGFARAKSLSEAQRRSIARKAAKARWNSELVTLTEIKHQVANALIDRSARAYLFGSYARLEATSRLPLRPQVELLNSAMA